MTAGGVAVAVPGQFEDDDRLEDEASSTIRLYAGPGPGIATVAALGLANDAWGVVGAVDGYVVRLAGPSP